MQRSFDRTIVEGSLPGAVWKLAWPTMLANVIGGLQGIVDQAMVGHYVGHIGNAAIGVSMQLFVLVIVFVSSVFTGMGILVARFAGAGEPDKVNRTVYQAFLAAVFMSLGILAPAGYFLAPTLLDVVNAAPEVQGEALSYIRIVFVFSIGMLIFFMMSGALRAAGDARTPLRLGFLMTGLNIVLNVIPDPRSGPDPGVGHQRRRDGNSHRQWGNRCCLSHPVVLRPPGGWFLADHVIEAGLGGSFASCSGSACQPGSREL